MIKLIHCLVTTAGVAALTWTIAIFKLDASPAIVPIVYLLVVMLAALLSGRIAAVWASLCSFLAFNWFFVTPRYTLIVQEPGEWIALCMFLLTAIVTGQLMALLKARASEAQQRQKEAMALSEASWAIASKLDTNSALNEVLKQISKVVDLEAAAVILSSDSLNEVAARYPEQNNEASRLIDSADISLPIRMNDCNLGTLSLKLTDGKTLSSSEKGTVDSLVNHAAVILQRETTLFVSRPRLKPWPMRTS